MTLPEIATAKQHQMFNFGSRFPYSILAADPRLGKTATAIWLQQRRNCNCLIICPAYLIANWKREIGKWAPNASVTTFKSGKEIYEVFDSDFVVTSYDLVRKSEHLFEWADMVVIDEAHALKNTSSQRSQFIHRCIFENSVKYVHLLTGTPIKNRVREFFSLLAITYYDPRLKENPFLDTYPDEITFAERFSYPQTYELKVKGRRVSVTQYTGLRNSEELRSWLKGRFVRIKADTKDLPPISYVETLVSDIDDTALLDAFEDYFRDESTAYKMARGNEYALRKLRTSSTLPEHKRNAALKKVPFAIKYVENLVESVDCCLVYSDHREPIEKIAAHFKVPAITGSTPPARRAQLVSDFQSGKLNMLCATIGSLKEGADLYRAKDLVLVDPPWIPGDLHQVINRMRALGEKDPRTVHKILGSPQDLKISEVLEEKMKTIELATSTKQRERNDNSTACKQTSKSRGRKVPGEGG